MRFSHVSFLTVLGTVLLLGTLSLPTDANESPSKRNTLKKRDLLGSLLPFGGQPTSSPPSSASPGPLVASPSVPTSPAPVPVGQQPSTPSSGSTSDPSKTGGNTAPPPSLIGDILNTPLVSNTDGSNAPASNTTPASAPGGGNNGSGGTSPKKKPTGSSSGTQDTDASPDAGSDNPGVNPSPQTTVTDKAKSTSGDDQGLSPGLITLLIVVIAAVLAAVLFSCYKIRQAKQRRRQSWNEDILKNHSGSVGYSSEGGGYGMYVGGTSGSKERPDLWRKNLDLFHRE
ncbi:hypothetical protein BGZ99_004924 [Dissophora globulifera]|uniref:Uncharacterized protein n=1 Tax=Dissophora globulifera TaxID=979702 RepID=A0A9P6RT50_9FUNG|nr:hypothetical protein BGZ99_004924 [Dissophora globulifera]